MSTERDAVWQEFEAIGPEEVRKRLGAQQYGERRAKVAQQFLAHSESLAASEHRRMAVAAAEEANELARNANELAEAANTSAREANASAREANELARSANVTAEDAAASARRTAEAASTSNTIATLALIAAIIAIAVSTMGLFLKR